MSDCLDSSSIMGLFRHIQGKHFYSAVMTLKKIKYKKGTHLVFRDQRCTVVRKLTILKSLSWNMPTFVGTESKWYILFGPVEWKVNFTFYFIKIKDII